MAPRIFGREPVLIVNFVEGVLTLALAFGLLKFIGIDSGEEVSIVVAVVSAGLGVYVAYVTKDTLLGALQGLVKAAVALFAAYGYNLTAEQLGALMAILVLGTALWHRTQTGPAVIPSLNLEQHSVEVPATGEATDTVPGLTVQNTVVERAVAPDLQDAPDEVKDQIESDGRIPAEGS